MQYFGRFAFAGNKVKRLSTLDVELLFLLLSCYYKLSCFKPMKPT